MADREHMTHRLAMHAAALASLGACPVWDAAVHAYLAADALQHADLEYGDSGRTQERHFRERLALESKYGPAWRKHPEAEAERKRIFREGEESTDRWTERYCQPLWAAARSVASTPAPSMAAASFKAALIEAEEVWNDRDFNKDPMQILQADFDRLTDVGGAA